MSDLSRFDKSDELSDALETALFAAQRPVPAGFAHQATARFERALAKRRRQRMILSIAATCLISAACAWTLVLDAFGLTGAIWDGIVSAVVFMSSVMTVWSHLPVVGIFFSVGMMALVLFAYALLTKLEGTALENRTYRS